MLRKADEQGYSRQPWGEAGQRPAVRWLPAAGRFLRAAFCVLTAGWLSLPCPVPLGSLPTLLMLLKSHAACTLHSSRDSSMDGNLTGITLERKSWAGCWLRTLAAAAQLPSADIFLGNLEQITSSPLALVSPFIQGNADCVSQCRCDVVTYHTQILCNGDTINSIATLSDPAVMSLPVWKLLQLIRKHSCPEIPFWEKSKEGLCHVLVSRCLHCSSEQSRAVLCESLWKCALLTLQSLCCLPAGLGPTPHSKPCRNYEKLFSCFFFLNSKTMEINDHKPLFLLHVIYLQQFYTKS